MTSCLRILVGTFLVWQLGCAPGSTPQDLPAFELDFSCSPSQNASCSSALGRKAFLGLTLNTATNCVFLLKTAGLASLHQQFDYSSQTSLESFSEGVWGRFQTFYDSQGAPSRFLEAGFYRACGFIDANFNGFLDAGEPLLDQAWNPATDLNRHFENWGSAP